jgi:hypothetical protein
MMTSVDRSVTAAVRTPHDAINFVDPPASVGGYKAKPLAAPQLLAGGFAV